jgi:8-oxo-dGTP diphosphatase
VLNLHKGVPAVDEQWEASLCDCPRVTVDVAILTLRERVLQALLVRRGRWPFEGMWSLPGRPVGVDEGLEVAAARTLAEETGLSGAFLDQLHTFGEPRRDPRRRAISVSYLALVPAAERFSRSVRTNPETQWWPVYDLPLLAFDHERILGHALARLRHKLETTIDGFDLLPGEFTLPEIQAAYESVLGQELDRRNFRRKMLGSGRIEPSGHLRGGGGRPARLYRYRKDSVA